MSGQQPRALKPLAGVRILDLSRMIAGGVAGMQLADFGADVVKVEQPGSGDPLRQWTTDGEPFWWQVYGRNKRFITLNLKSPEGVELLSRLVPRFDVVIESFVPGTLERLGLGWDVLKAGTRVSSSSGFRAGARPDPRASARGSARSSRRRADSRR